MRDADALEGLIAHDKAIEAKETEDPGMELVGAAAVVAVHDHDFGTLAAGFLEVVAVGEAKHVLLESVAGLIAHKLFLCGHGNPSLFRHSVENGGSRKKAVSVRCAGVRVLGEDRGREAREFGDFEWAMEAIAVSAKGLVLVSHLLSGSLVF